MKVKNILKTLLNNINYFPLNVFYKGNGHVLMFHNVLPEEKCSKINRKGLEVTPDYLEQTILYFKKRGYVFLSLDELYTNLNNGIHTKKFVVYTFDDGYSGCLHYAAPVFEKHNVPFSIYICSSFIENKLILWWYLLEKIILENSNIEFEANNIQYSYDCGTFLKKKETFMVIRRMIIRSKAIDFEQLITNIFSKHFEDFTKLTSKYSLTWDEVKILSQNKLVTLGAHTINHLNLKSLSYENSYWEISESKKILESKIGKEVTHFAYPFGGESEVSMREIEICKKLGFKTAQTTLEGNIFKKHRNHLLALPRLIIYNATPEELNLKINGGCVLTKKNFKRVVTID